jgi:hypothetical protein
MRELLKSEGLKASADIAKLVITLCSGAVAFTVTFLEKFTAHTEGQALHAPLGLYVAWALFGLAILFSLWTLMAITGTLESLDRQANGWPLAEAQRLAAEGVGGNVKIPALLMLGTFLMAVLAMILTGVELAQR